MMMPWKGGAFYRGHYIIPTQIIPTQTMHYYKGIHENYYKFALFDSPQIGNLMTPVLNMASFGIYLKFLGGTVGGAINQEHLKNMQVKVKSWIPISAQRSGVKIPTKKKIETTTYHGNPITFIFRGITVITHILRAKSLHFSRFWGPKVEFGSKNM